MPRWGNDPHLREWSWPGHDRKAAPAGAGMVRGSWPPMVGRSGKAFVCPRARKWTWPFHRGANGTDGLPASGGNSAGKVAKTVGVIQRHRSNPPPGWADLRPRHPAIRRCSPRARAWSGHLRGLGANHRQVPRARGKCGGVKCLRNPKIELGCRCASVRSSLHPYRYDLMDKCHLGCGLPGLFRHPETGKVRCSKNVSSCPARQAAQTAINDAKRAAREAARVPEPCRCGRPGVRWKASAKQWSCYRKGEPMCRLERETWSATMQERHGIARTVREPGHAAQARAERTAQPALCHLGCGQPGLFQHKLTGVWRCSKNVSSCPSRQAAQAAINDAKRLARLAKEAARILEPCRCGQPGLHFNKRTKVWRCFNGTSPRGCPAIQADWEATMLERYGTTKMAHIEGVQDRRSVILREQHEARGEAGRKEIDLKRQATMLERYGVAHASQSATVQDAVRAGDTPRHE